MKINITFKRYFKRNIAAVKHPRDWASALLENTRSQKTISSLSIFDNRIPNLRTAYRTTEFNEYLHIWQDAILYSSSGRSAFTSDLIEYRLNYPEVANQIQRFTPFHRIRSQAAYFLFLGNGIRFLETIERHQLPFAFTLYPGGGFVLESKASDQVLMRIFSSPYFRKVIVTQKISYEYLRSKKFCSEENINFIYGVVVPLEKLICNRFIKNYYPIDKENFDVCFVSYKYMKGGLDKGYDIFLEVAKRLHLVSSNIRFHIVGDFDESDIEIDALFNKITFYGAQTTEFFSTFYTSMDIIISPNRPFVLNPGAFDGFPTGSVIESMLCGVAAFCTDPLNQNIIFRHAEDIVIIPEEIDIIIDQIIYYFSHLDELYKVAMNGRNTCINVFGVEAQLHPRIEILSNIIRNG
ncbi:MAG: LPS biosynthesis protein RfbU [Chloroflexi bacterium]|nr:LPS biosynthesis protein RfbU [Chloroflexota bacterium]